VRRPCYQGKRFTSGACVDCSGKFREICISTITRTLAQQPIQDAAITHHAEIIQLPRFFAIAVVGSKPGCTARIQSVPRQAHRLSADRHSYVCQLTTFPFTAFDSIRYPAWQVEVLPLNPRRAARAAPQPIAFRGSARRVGGSRKPGIWSIPQVSQLLLDKLVVVDLDFESGRCRLALHGRLQVEATR
jgi:hypothetical protein